MRPLIKIHGGKAYLYKWIISHFPSDYTQRMYLEPCIGGGSVLLNKQSSIVEMAGDSNRDLISLWYTVQRNCLELSQLLGSFTYDETTFLSLEKWREKVMQEQNRHHCGFMDTSNRLLLAAYEYAQRRMSRGGLGKDFAWSDRQRGGKPGDVNGWETSLYNLEHISRRINYVTFIHQNCLEMLQQNNFTNAFAYIDPPYLKSTRVSREAYGPYEMSDQQHTDLLSFLTNEFKGKFMLSGYASELYKKYLNHCNYAERSVANNASQSKKKQKKLEKIWYNY